MPPKAKNKKGKQKIDDQPVVDAPQTFASVPLPEPEPEPLRQPEPEPAPALVSHPEPAAGLEPVPEHEHEDNENDAWGTGRAYDDDWPTAAPVVNDWGMNAASSTHNPPGFSPATDVKGKQKSTDGEGQSRVSGAWGDTSRSQVGDQQRASTTWATNDHDNVGWGQLTTITKKINDSPAKDTIRNDTSKHASWGMGGQAAGWGAQTLASPGPSTATGGWKGWADEARQYSYSSAPSKTVHFAGSKNDVTVEQRNDILEQLLSDQTHNPYIQEYREVGSSWPAEGGFAQGQHAMSAKYGGTHNTSKKEKKRRTKQQGWEQQQGNDPWSQSTVQFGWGPIPEDEEPYNESRRVHFSPKVSANLWADFERKSMDLNHVEQSPAYTMPSRTMAHATKGITRPPSFGLPYNSMNEYTDVDFLESEGQAILSVQNALFGNSRLAKDRIHWMFSPDKDERVSTLLMWIETMSYNLGAFGLHKFLQSRERGALFTNADFRLPEEPNRPVFDWLTFDVLQKTKDKILQESVAFYDPAVQVILFVFLPSASGNSVAIWRRKLKVPNNMRLMLQGQLRLALAGLPREKDYLVHVDSLPGKVEEKKQTANKKAAAKVTKTSTTAKYPTTEKEVAKTKKRRWWHIFTRVDW